MASASETRKIRRATSDDIAACGSIAYRGFKAIAEEHGFPPDFPSAEVADAVLADLISNPEIYGIVTEQDGRVIGSNFMDERAIIFGIGPISVDPDVQNSGAGRGMMVHMLERTASRGAPGVRLVQNAYHNRSLSLYAKLGFEIREPLSTMQGPAIRASIPGYTVRAATESDLKACNAVHFASHGFDRASVLRDAIKHGGATVVEHLGRITGYATAIAFFGHAVGRSNDDLKALISATPSIPPPGLLVPSRNGELLRWCYANGLRLVQQMTLMTVGMYNEPATPYLPSILY